MNTIERSIIHDIVKVEPIEDYSIRIQFDDGVVKTIDIKPFIDGGISTELRDINFFNRVYLDNGSVTWPNGYDFCPVFLRKL
ncbi:MAG: DUF2442 domain-containing protein [Ignavibacteria bacterium]|nr:DUF2442 domain-containing protein [Ignavibacteria bacterium]